MVRDFSQKTVQELYETIRVNVDEEEQWKVFDFVEDFFMEELEIGDYINDINSYHLYRLSECQGYPRAGTGKSFLRVDIDREIVH